MVLTVASLWTLQRANQRVTDFLWGGIIILLPVFYLCLCFISPFFFHLSHFVLLSDPALNVLFSSSRAASPSQFTETLPVVLLNIPFKSHFMLSDFVALSPFLPFVSD